MYLIAARAENNVIGRGADIPWHVKGEQRLFREITSGHTLVMGRKTFESIGKPLPNRDTVIISRQKDFSAPGCQVAPNLDAALRIADQLRGETFIAGGGEIYRQSIDQAEGIHLTTIHATIEGDIYFPEFDSNDYDIIDSQDYESNINYSYQFLKKKRAF